MALAYGMHTGSRERLAECRVVGLMVVQRWRGRYVWLLIVLVWIGLVRLAVRSQADRCWHSALGGNLLLSVKARTAVSGAVRRREDCWHETSSCGLWCY